MSLLRSTWRRIGAEEEEEEEEEKEADGNQVVFLITCDRSGFLASVPSACSSFPRPPLEKKMKTISIFFLLAIHGHHHHLRRKE